MKRIIALTALCIGLCAALTGCPANQSQQVKAINAVHIALTAGRGVQDAEILAYQSHLVPDADHQVIQESFMALGRASTAADSCLGAASTSEGILACVNSVVSTVDTLNSDGVTHLKSAEAKADFTAAMQSVKASLSVITAVVGGK